MTVHVTPTFTASEQHDLDMLATCKHCGAKPYIQRGSHTWIGCPVCGMRTPMCSTFDKAREIWNSQSFTMLLDPDYYIGTTPVLAWSIENAKCAAPDWIRAMYQVCGNEYEVTVGNTWENATIVVVKPFDWIVYSREGVTVMDSETFIHTVTNHPCKK